jgi:polyisoprenyl-phosphate glycosyltransferase
MLAVVTPVFEDAEAASFLLADLVAAFGDQVTVVAVDDGSVRHPLGRDLLETAGIAGVALTLRRNVGHQRAIAIGLAYAVEHITDAEYIVVMDSDGEDRPASIRNLLDALASPHVDIAVAQRRARHEPLGFRLFYVFYKLLFRVLTGRKIGFGNFMALKRSAAVRLAAMQETWIHFASAVLVSKLRIAPCPTDRGKRYAGTSKMNFVSLALHGLKGLMVVAEDVLVRVGTACGLIAGGAVIASIAAIVLKVIGVATPGWFSIAFGILFLVFVQMGTLSLMTLMLTGVVRGGLINNVRYEDFIAARHASMPKRPQLARTPDVVV